MHNLVKFYILLPLHTTIHGPLIKQIGLIYADFSYDFLEKSVKSVKSVARV